jgi:hypothetical protein
MAAVFISYTYSLFFSGGESRLELVKKMETEETEASPSLYVRKNNLKYGNNSNSNVSSSLVPLTFRNMTINLNYNHNNGII